MPSQGSGALVWDAERLRDATGATNAAGVALWSWNVGSDKIDLDERACNLWGVPPGQPVTFSELFACIHSANFDRVRSDFVAIRSRQGAYESTSASYWARASRGSRRAAVAATSASSDG